jgi:hypothetical protein
MPEPKTRKFLAQKEREERQKKIIVIATAVVLAIVLGLVVYGIIDQQVIEPKKKVIELDSRSINATEFEERVSYQRYQLISQAYQVLQIQQSLGSDPQMAGYFQQQLMQIFQQLQQPLLIGQQVIQSASDDLIILEEAEQRGLEVSDQELDREVEELFGFFREGTPTPEPTFEAFPTSTLSPEQLTLVPPTATPTAGEETEGDQPAPTSTQAADPTAPANQDPTATPLLQPTEYTEELFQEQYQEAINNLKREANLSEETFRTMVRAFVLRGKLREQITQDVPRTQEQVWARHILVEDQETAQEVLDKLAEGESFVELAAEYSTDQSNNQTGGNLGWFSRERMVSAFAEAAWELEVGEISEPVQTDFGYHIIQKLGHEDRPISQSEYEERQDRVFSEWLEEKRKEYRPEINPDWMEFVTDKPSIPPQLQQIITAIQQGQSLPAPTQQ